MSCIEQTFKMFTLFKSIQLQAGKEDLSSGQINERSDSTFFSIGFYFSIFYFEESPIQPKWVDSTIECIVYLNVR